MGTIFVLCGCIGHFLGASGRPSRSVCDTLYASPNRRNNQTVRAFGRTAKLSDSERREN
jgi:hypothetical protein